MADDENTPVTPRVCEACGGDKEGAPCLWCTRGFQDLHQQRAWHRFRSRMKRISSTYSFLEETIHDLLRRLDAVGLGESALARRAHALTVDGNRLLESRDQAPDRRLATEELRAWHKAAVDLLLEHATEQAKAAEAAEVAKALRLSNRPNKP